MAACAWFWNAFFYFEDAVDENLFIVLSYGRIDRDMNVKFWIVLKYCNECNG